MFDESEKRHPVQENERIKVENIHGKLIFIGAEVDLVWRKGAEYEKSSRETQKGVSERGGMSV